MPTLLERLNGPGDLRGLDEGQLAILAAEIRETIVSTVARTGGHLGSSLGVVELTIALHRMLDSPRDKIVWDTGHQAYAHKLLTGRLDRFGTLRQIDGVGGFPRRSESEHDVFDGGHAGTGLSIAEGLAAARDLRHGLERIAVVVGDAALMTGLSLEALNDIGHRGTQMLIVLNDNEMSISPTVGAFSTYLSKIKLSGAWRQSKTFYDRLVERIPVIGPTALMWSQRVRRSVVNLASPGQLFEDLGITYIGVIPGHDLRMLNETFRRVQQVKGPVLVHVRTQKGRGYRPAETDQVSFHGAALPPIELAPKADAFDGARLEAARAEAAQADSRQPHAIPPGAPHGAGSNGDALSPAGPEPAPKKAPNYTAVFVSELMKVAEHDRRVVAITAGMPTGTGLARFQASFPDRFIDVGIAEQHAVTMATGMALAGLRPVVAIYSTFLQRAFDQVVHDVCQNDVPVVLAVDRAGLVGEDGTSHQGMFTIAAQRQLPYLIIASPKDEQELRSLLHTALEQDHPFALHYPRDAGFGVPEVEPPAIPVGRGEVLREGRDIVLVGFGPIVMRGLEVADALARDGWSVGLVNARFAKPLDRQLILDAARGVPLVVTLEESVVTGGFGSAVLEAIEDARLTDPELRRTMVRLIGIPGDRFVDHGAVADLRRLVRLDSAGISAQVREAADALGLSPSGTVPAAKRAAEGHSRHGADHPERAKAV
ncbi:MAG TPA: 1-deoxy-D-xylulose-5-phosphate synthase [Candidatus Limnocylindrales bacterium]|nr:1-deoxy-D-xylulose-5-phosphate synthase [Candidatus Limnocylindrales bacterium]